jgi:hypothetical protein
MDRFIYSFRHPCSSQRPVHAVELSLAEPNVVYDGRQHRNTGRNSNLRCHLLSLPPEIRNEILQLVLTDVMSIVNFQIHYSRNFPSTESEAVQQIGRNAQEQAREPAITRTCQEITEETPPVFYTVNTSRVYAEQGVAVAQQACTRQLEAVRTHPHLIKVCEVYLCDNRRMKSALPSMIQVIFKEMYLVVNPLAEASDRYIDRSLAAYWTQSMMLSDAIFQMQQERGISMSSLLGSSGRSYTFLSK